MNGYQKPVFLALTSLLVITCCLAQPVTGVWNGNAGKYRLELKIIKSGDSLAGTAYYYSSKTNYKRYSIKGYFEPKTNNTIWWDDVLIEDRTKLNTLAPALMSIADFNCPGETETRLDGNSFLRDEQKKLREPLALQKVKSPLFGDEWDWVIENYTVGASDPYIIDSIRRLSGETPYIAEVKKATPKTTVMHTPEQPVTKTRTTLPPIAIEEKKKVPPTVALTPEEKFTSRTKILQQVIPIRGDSIELRFYDNAEVDGDSIALFLNNKMVFMHVMLTEQAHTIKFAVKDLQDDNEVVMVAENLGSIPPNTALMVAMVGDKRYEAHLYATENSSALIRFMKEAKAGDK